jgi:hypothetical protein
MFITLHEKFSLVPTRKITQQYGLLRRAYVVSFGISVIHLIPLSTSHSIAQSMLFTVTSNDELDGIPRTLNCRPFYGIAVIQQTIVEFRRAMHCNVFHLKDAFHYDGSTRYVKTP